MDTDTNSIILMELGLTKNAVRRMTGQPVIEEDNAKTMPYPQSHVTWGGAINSSIYFRAPALKWMEDNGFKIDDRTRFKVGFQKNGGADVFLNFTEKGGNKLLLYKGNLKGPSAKMLSVKFYDKMPQRRCWVLAKSKKYDIRLRCVWKDK